MRRDMKEAHGFSVASVDVGSIAEEVGIQPGDRIVDFNNQPFIDIIDYEFFASKNRLSIGYIDQNGDPIKAKIKKLSGESIGLHFNQELLGKPNACGNRCIFCFVDQLPKGLRRSLYLKDEDWRHSFLFGNYVTLSLLSRQELKRIRKRKISRLYISVHAVDEKVRRMLLGNDRARPIKPILRRLKRFGVEMHTQIVLLSGINDGEVLHQTYRFLKRLYPQVQSVAVIPVGLTGHREGLYPLQPISRQDAIETLKVVHDWQTTHRKKTGKGFIYAADELYIKAGEALPDADDYDGFPQIENGVGLIAKFMQEFEQELATIDKAEPCYNKTAVLTGEAVFPYVKQCIDQINEKYQTKILCISAKNGFFGGGVDVTGLLTGNDVAEQLNGMPKFDAVYLSESMLKDGETVFLDDITVAELEAKIGAKVEISPVRGDEFLHAFLKAEE